MAIPDYQSLMLPVLRSAAAGEARIADVTAQLAAELGLTDEERAVLLPSGRQTVFANRVHWAKTYLTKAGLLVASGRGRYALSDVGRRVLSEAPARIDNRYLRRFDGFSAFVGGERGAVAVSSPSEADSPAGELTPDETLRTAHAALDRALMADVLARLRAASPAFFERVVVQLLLAMGYGGSVTALDDALTGGSGDHGIDGVIDQDPLGLDRLYVQAKRYQDGSPVGSGAIRDFFGSLDRVRAGKGLFVTTSAFTASARETAGILSKRIVLIDGERFAALMLAHGVGCRTEETLVIRRIDEEFFTG